MSSRLIGIPARATSKQVRTIIHKSSQKLQLSMHQKSKINSLLHRLKFQSSAAETIDLSPTP
jgi:hypothetical protein